jgi:methyl-accepting chemotaxis protein
MAQNCKEQTISAEQIQQAMAQMDSITQQNSATSEEAASASEELASQAQLLQDIVSRFRFDASNTKPAASVKKPSYPSRSPRSSKQLGWHTDDEFKEIH